MPSDVSAGDKPMKKKRSLDSTLGAPGGPVQKKLKEAKRTRNKDRDDQTASPPSSLPYNNNSLLTNVDIQTPRNSIQPATQRTPLSNSTNVSIDSAGRSIPMLETGSGVSVHLELEDGDYVVRVKRRSITSSTNESNVEATKQLAQSAGMLFLQAEILRDMGEQLLAQYRASLPYVMGNTARRIDFTRQ